MEIGTDICLILSSSPPQLLSSSSAPQLFLSSSSASQLLHMFELATVSRVANHRLRNATEAPILSTNHQTEVQLRNLVKVRIYHLLTFSSPFFLLLFSFSSPFFSFSLFSLTLNFFSLQLKWPPCCCDVSPLPPWG